MYQTLGDWISETGMPLMFLLAALGGLGFCTAITVDGVVYGRAAYDDKVACQAQRMEASRMSFTTDVTCIPVVTRQDTTTVNLNQTGQ